MANPPNWEDWLTLENLKDMGAGIVVGAIGVLAAIKRGWLIVGDKVAMAAENARLEERVDRLSADVKEREDTIADLRKRLGE